MPLVHPIAKISKLQCVLSATARSRDPASPRRVPFDPGEHGGALYLLHLSLAEGSCGGGLWEGRGKADDNCAFS
jgi:hypothetical protein